MRYLFFSTFLLISTFIFGQQKFVPHDFAPSNMPNYKPAYQDNFPDWAKMLYQENINYFHLEEAYLQWKTTAEDEFKSIEKYYKIWQAKVLPFVANDGQIRLDKFNTVAKPTKPIPTTGSKSTWSFLGPKETFWLNESGDTQAPKACPWQVNIYSFDVAKNNHATLYCGTETGFVSKSVDNGLTWELQGQDYSFGSGITTLAIHPTNENIVYAAANRQVHKTLDGGQTWTPLLPSNNLFYADKLVIDETNPNKIFAAGSTGIYQSVDGGENWTNVWPHQSYDIHFKSGDNTVLYAISNIADEFTIAVSTDGGDNFSSDPNFPTQIQDASGALIAVTAADANALFTVLLSSDNTPLLYKGDMADNTWSLLATGQTAAFPMDNWQGFFDLVLEVSPTDADVIFTGTSTLYKSVDGGADFSIVGGYGGNFPIHPDIQSLKLLDDGTAWVATDGGFTYSTDNFTTTNNAHARNKNLVGSDMWGFDQGWNEDIVVGGRYHNGNTAIADFYASKALRMGGAESPTGWVMKGKSRHVAFDDLGAGWILPATAEGTPEGRFTFSKHPNMDEYGGRRGNVLFHPNYYELVYMGKEDAFWKSSDMGTSFELLHDFGDRIRFCQIAYDDPNVIYADIVNQGLYKSEDGGYNWVAKPSLTNGNYGTNHWKGKLHFVISPTDAQTIYACLQNGTWSADIGKIFKSTDGGDTWQDWSGSLNTFTKTLVIQPDANGEDLLYLIANNNDATVAQSYIRRQGENDWTAYGTAYPAGMKTNHALAFYRDSKIRVAGTGGVWENTLDEPNFQPIVQPWVERPFFDCMLDTIQFDDHSMLNHENASWAWTIEPAPLYISDANSRNPKVVLGAVGSYDVTLSVTKDGETYSKTIEDMVSTITCPSVEDCSNPAFLDKNNWSLLYVNSEEVNYPGTAVMAFDNDPATIWHTRWSTGSDPYPHEMQIDLGEEYSIHEFTYLPRQDGQNGWIKDYELYFTNDLADWGTAVAIGAFESSNALHKVTLEDETIGRYLKIVALSEANGNAWASAAEFGIKGCYYDPVSTNTANNYEQLKAFPVPSQGHFDIALPAHETFHYTIYTMSGKQVQQGQSQAGQNRLALDLAAFPSGTYVVQLRDVAGGLYLVKLVKE